MIEQINSLIKDLGIDNSEITEETSIGERGIGFDSQELVEFTCMMEKEFKVKLPRNFLDKDNTIAEIVESIKNVLGKPAADSPFEGHCEGSIQMNCSADKAYKAIYELEKWPENLPHVERIEVLYNDGVYQEFLMDVISNTGLINVRSIRRCITNDTITFFQPNPPKFLKHHCGGWKFEATTEGCMVTTWHQWNLHPEKAQEIFPEEGGLSSQQRVEKVLLSHAELALETWKKILEGNS